VIYPVSSANWEKRKRPPRALGNFVNGGAAIGEYAKSRAGHLPQPANALGYLVLKSSSPTHSGVTVIRTIDVIIVRSCPSHAFACC